jgi:hypothetical protein
MSVSFIRYLACWILLLVVPSTLLGQTPAAILHTQGGVWVNGYEARDSSAVFPGDVIETKVGFAGNLTIDGTTVMMQQETVGKLEADEFELDHGGVSVTTSRSFKVRVNCLRVVPVANDWTEYDVTDVNGTVQVAARKLDVNVERVNRRKPSEESPVLQQQGSVHQGEERSYRESDVCGAGEKLSPATTLNGKWIAAGAGVAGTGLVLCLLLCTGGGKQTPLSSSQP